MVDPSLLCHLNNGLTLVNAHSGLNAPNGVRGSNRIAPHLAPEVGHFDALFDKLPDPVHLREGHKLVGKGLLH